MVGASAEELAAWRIGGAIGHPLDPGRWAEERQYLRNDTRTALAAFQRRRAEVLELLRSLSPTEWQRGGIHLSRGRLTLADWVARLAGHDDNHSPSSAARSKVGHEVSGVVAAQSNFGMQPTAFGHSLVPGRWTDRRRL